MARSTRSPSTNVAAGARITVSPPDNPSSTTADVPLGVPSLTSTWCAVPFSRTNTTSCGPRFTTAASGTVTYAGSAAAGADSFPRNVT